MKGKREGIRKLIKSGRYGLSVILAGLMVMYLPAMVLGYDINEGNILMTAYGTR
ncbi:MAG: hypothetical protein K6G22_02540 [Lachnospiraceae bacterium]|nr:hypothetical protein [Lachnospiraceae bacterium]